MSEESKRDIAEMCNILESLSADDLALIKGGAMILKAKQEMEGIKNEESPAIKPGVEGEFNEKQRT